MKKIIYQNTLRMLSVLSEMPLVFLSKEIQQVALIKYARSTNTGYNLTLSMRMCCQSMSCKF